MTDEQVPWPWRGLDQHTEEAQSSEKVGIWLGRIYEGLDLIAYMINLATTSLNETEKATNVLAALACYTRAFRGIRAATILSTSGLYLEARVYARDIYESASLARMLANRPDKADSWMLANRWINDNEVRQYAQNFTAPGMPIQDSAYRQYYQLASDIHHPTARACLPLVLTDPSSPCAPQLTPDYNEDALSNSLAEIALECGFVCLTMINAAAGPEVIPPLWRQAVTEFITAIGAGADWAHLERDWQAEADLFADLATHVVPADQLAALLRDHPNSLDNVRARRDQN
ncbi:hypothetical protein AB0C24_24515 [Amycolatopsis japonica]|uniref:hypothetical protein n=1 Tax=Amycolatopsis japonica TaxID=208439 RepID=UPI0033D265F0